MQSASDQGHNVSSRTGGSAGRSQSGFHESWYFPILIVVLAMIRLTTLLISLQCGDLLVADILKPGKKKERAPPAKAAPFGRQGAAGQSAV